LRSNHDIFVSQFGISKKKLNFRQQPVGCDTEKGYIFCTIVIVTFLQSSAGIPSCFVVVVAVVAVIACLLVLYSMEQFDNLPLQQGSHVRMQFGILPLQQGNSRHVHVVWYHVTASDCK
jgi:hypothetical protein